MTTLIEIDRLNNLDIVKKLNSLLFNFFGLELFFFQFNKDKVDDYCEIDSLCKLVYSTRKKTECNKLLLKDIQKAISKKDLVIHNCFLKTRRIIIPVMVNRKVYGIVLSGQIKIKGTKFPAERKTIGNEILMSEVMKRFKNLIAIDKNQFNVLVNFLRSFISYIFISRFEEVAFMSSRRSKSHLQDAISKALDYINENYYRSNLNLSEVSEAVNLSPYYFSHQFKKEHETTFIDYLTKVRLEASVKLLKDLRLSIAQISFAVGYQDPNYFSKVFKKYIDISPVEYRDKVATQNVSYVG